MKFEDDFLTKRQENYNYIVEPKEAMLKEEFKSVTLC